MNIIYSCAPSLEEQGSAQHGERSRGGLGTCWSHSQPHSGQADDSPVTLAISKQLQGSSEDSLLSPTNMLEHSLGQKNHRCLQENQKTLHTFIGKFLVFLENLAPWMQQGQICRREKICLLCLEEVGVGKTSK